LISSMKGKTLADLISAMIDGETYVNVNTPDHIKGEIRGQIEVEGKNMGN
jgi:CHRD domain